MGLINAFLMLINFLFVIFHVASEEDARKHYYDDVTGDKSDVRREGEAGSGAGDDEDAEDDDEYYYYEDGNKSNKQKQTK